MSVTSLTDRSKTTTQEVIPDEITDLGISWVNLIFHGPIFGSIFAFAFVIGYFYSINITWFPFFSLAEHLVFALQGLPVALGGSIILLILVSISHNSDIWLISPERKPLWLKRIGLTWIITLFIAIAWFGYDKSVAGPFCFLALMAGVYCFTFIHSPDDKIVHVVYWGINVATLCLLVGFVTGEFHKYDPILLTLSMKGEGAGNDKINGSGIRRGQILFYGNSGVLFFDRGDGEVSLIRKDSITKISDQP